ncbi:MAG: hypothetical protein IPQ07_38055 [Myxococcales bacterium]|nr:hypothetical protein [Myxococcales bacterium]
MSDLIELPAFCDDFHATPKKEARRAYVANELRRIHSEGLPVLRTVLSCPDDEVQALATALLAANVDDDGEEILPDHLWRLRLADGAVPPSTDPQGRKLPKSDQGRVLVCKIGNKGGRLQEDATKEQVEAHSGPRRTTTVRAGRDLYDTAPVSAVARTYSFRNAVLILRQWGVGCTAERARMEPDRDGNPVEVQNYWLVEEVLEAREPREHADEPEAPKRKRAA